jgi:hypothetical protein
MIKHRYLLDLLKIPLKYIYICNVLDAIWIVIYQNLTVE